MNTTFTLRKYKREEQTKPKAKRKKIIKLYSGNKQKYRNPCPNLEGDKVVIEGENQHCAGKILTTRKQTKSSDLQYLLFSVM